MAHLDVCLTDDQEVARSTPARSATVFHRNCSWNIFYVHSLPSAASKRQLSVSGKSMCTILVNCLEDLACSVKVWLGKLTTLVMTPFD